MHCRKPGSTTVVPLPANSPALTLLRPSAINRNMKDKLLEVPRNHRRSCSLSEIIVHCAVNLNAA